MYSVFAELLEKFGVKASDVSKATGINQTVFSEWKKGKSTPKADKRKKIADYFGVSLEYLDTGKESEVTEPYYLNDDAREMAQFMFENPEYKVLFDATRKIKKEDIQFVKEMIDRLSTRE